MAEEIWSANGGRPSSYHAHIGNYTWALTLKAVGWVLENLTAPMADVFVAPVSASMNVLFLRATLKARATA